MAIPNNLISDNNENFETSVGDWFGGNASVSRVTTQAHQGSASLQASTSGAGSTWAGLVGIPVVAGTDYRIYAYLRAGVAGWSGRIDIDWYTSGGGWLASSSSSSVGLTQDVWTVVDMTATAVATAAEARIFVGNVAAGSAGQLLFLDAVYFGPPNTAPTVPTNLTAADIRGTEIDLTWTASTDDSGVASYDVEVVRI